MAIKAVAGDLGLGPDFKARLLDHPRRAFTDMDGAAFNRFVALDDPTFARFNAMAPERLSAYAGMSDDAFNRFTALSPTDFAKFERLSPAAPGRFAALPADLLNSWIHWREASPRRIETTSIRARVVSNLPGQSKPGKRVGRLLRGRGEKTHKNLLENYSIGGSVQTLILCRCCLH